MAFPVELHLSTPLLSLLSPPSPLPSFPLPSFSLPLPKPLLSPRLTSTLLSPRRAVLRRRFALLVASDSGERINLELHPEQGLNGAAVGEEEVVEVDEGRRRRKWRGLKDRVVFGLGIGVGVGGVVVTGGWLFAVALAAASFVGAREYFEMIRSREMAIGMTPPPRYVSRVCSVICALMPLFMLYLGQIDVSVTSSAFIVALALILQRGNPRFAQLSSAIFGLFYCGYLPCFWIKLRCGLTVPALNTRLSTFWPVFLGGPTHWTVGLIATLISISSIIAADTFAFLGGKFFGRTPLTAISPKKTLEGALAGLVGCVCVSVILSSMSRWPMSVLSAAAFGFLNFVGSLSGDLIESIIKRDAGVKDSGSLIPGHGGILDRVDSYVFTGALSYSFVKTMLPLFGV